ncbi:MAG: transglycosylase SLT domain-containing protein [Zoogloeaceae bacterium]|nr:transglycosylase SLT domain-containing protein [Rhodocyclaceae bacterium]MCP5223169.1 transglycosylase SLT domain-containing protein [Zoogloeaceae bacterium]
MSRCVVAALVLVSWLGGSTHAATRASSALQNCLAYEHGEGVPRDPEKAAACYCAAVRRGNAEAMYALGWMYANGRGLARDDAIAGTLFSMAARKGHDYAKRMARYTGPAQGKKPACLQSTWAANDRFVDQVMTQLSPAQADVVALVHELAPQFGIEPRFVLAIAAVESALDPSAVSPKNAMGVMQLIPETAARFNVRNPYDARQNIAGGLAYLRWLLAYFKGDVQMVAAAYNAGEGAVDRYRGVPPYPETRGYVSRVTAYYRNKTHAYDRRIVESSPVVAPLRFGQ